MGSLDMRFKISGAWDNWAVEAVGAQSCTHPGCRMPRTMDTQGCWDIGCLEL